jgi:hypothetical protein
MLAQTDRLEWCSAHYTCPKDSVLIGAAVFNKNQRHHEYGIKTKINRLVEESHPDMRQKKQNQLMKPFIIKST